MEKFMLLYNASASRYSILQGESQERIEALLENHPHLKMPDSSIEVLQLLPVPGP